MTVEARLRRAVRRAEISLSTLSHLSDVPVERIEALLDGAEPRDGEVAAIVAVTGDVEPPGSDAESRRQAAALEEVLALAEHLPRSARRAPLPGPVLTRR